MKKIISSLFCAVMIFTLSLPVFGYDSEHPSRLIDNADLLSSSEEASLLSKLDEISERQQFDVVIVIEQSIGDKTPMEYADDYYDYNGYGMGTDRDGAILLLSMEERDWYISTCGYGITAITDAGRESMSDRFVPYLSDGDYSEAFELYADLCDDYVTQAKAGHPYDVGNLPKEPFPYLIRIIISIVAGFVIAFIAVSIMKGKLTSVKMQDSASDYTKPGSMNVTERRDMFLYSHVSKTLKPKDSGSGGSSTHTSSSGSTHGGGGGKF